jgi:hypothetical protein
MSTEILIIEKHIHKITSNIKKRVYSYEEVVALFEDLQKEMKEFLFKN